MYSSLCINFMMFCIDASRGFKSLTEKGRTIVDRVTYSHCCQISKSVKSM